MEGDLGFRGTESREPGLWHWDRRGAAARPRTRLLAGDQRASGKAAHRGTNLWLQTIPNAAGNEIKAAVSFQKDERSQWLGIFFNPLRSRFAVFSSPSSFFFLLSICIFLIFFSFLIYLTPRQSRHIAFPVWNKSPVWTSTTPEIRELRPADGEGDTRAGRGRWQGTASRVSLVIPALIAEFSDTWRTWTQCCGWGRGPSESHPEP